MKQNIALSIFVRRNSYVTTFLLSIILPRVQHFVCIVFFLLATSAGAQITASQVDSIAYNEMIRQELPGFAIGVYQRGVINYTKGYGHIDTNRTKPITSSTPFRWASISKTLTAVATLQLDDRSSGFSTNDKVIDHYPHWISKVSDPDSGIESEVNDKSKKSNITIDHLLSHTSGINHYSKGTDNKNGQYKNNPSSDYIPDDQSGDNFNADSSIDIFRNAKLDFKPGTKYLYSTYAYNLLGAVVDNVSGSYTNWVIDNIKSKLGLTSLKVSTKNFSGFQKKADGIINANSSKSKESVLPGGGWESNVKDLLKFARGIMNGTLLSDASRLWSNGRRGLSSRGSDDNFRVWHGGAHDNLRTLMYIMPEKQIAVAVMIPAEYADTSNIVNRVLKLMGISRDIELSPEDKCNDRMNSSGTKIFVGIWRQTNRDVVIRRGYSTDNFNKEWKFLKQNGYQVFDLETYKHKGKLVWDGVFKKTGSGYAMYRGFNASGFLNKWREMRGQGFRLFDLETYTKGNQKKWAGLFKKARGNNGIYRNLSTSKFADRRKQMAESGYKLIDIEVTSIDDSLRWSGVWVSGNDGKLNRNSDFDEFKRVVQRRANSGFKLIDVETYTTNGKRLWAGVWEKSDQKQEVSFGLNYCDFMDMHSKHSADKFELIDMESYGSEFTINGVGHKAQGAAIAIGNIGSNARRPEILLVAYDAPSGENSFKYRIGWDIDQNGSARNWSASIKVAGLGHEGAGMGAVIADINKNGTPDLILMAYDAPAGQNAFKYRIGFDLNKTTGKARNWSNSIKVTGVGHEGDGAGMAIADINQNGMLDMVLMAYDAPNGANTFKYIVGFDLNRTGRARRWGSTLQIDGLGHQGNGAGVIVNDLDQDGELDMLLMAYDNPTGQNSFKYRTARSIDDKGKVKLKKWQNSQKVPGFGHQADGADIAAWDLDRNGKKDLVFMAYDIGNGQNKFKYQVIFDAKKSR